MTLDRRRADVTIPKQRTRRTTGTSSAKHQPNESAGPMSEASTVIDPPSTVVPTGSVEPRAVDRLMTIDQVAEYTQLPKNTLYKMRSEGQGPRAARLGKHLRYRKSDVDAWITSRLEDWPDNSSGRHR